MFFYCLRACMLACASLCFACGLALVVPSKGEQCPGPRIEQQVPRGFRPEASCYCSWTGSIGRLPLQVGIILDHHGNVANNVAVVAPVRHQLTFHPFKFIKS